MRLAITALAGGGRGVARHDGTVWLVAGALPGEVVEVVAERRRAGIVEARAVAVVAASEWRAEDPCPWLEKCGGCDLGHVRATARHPLLREVTCGALRHAPPALAAAVQQAEVVGGTGTGRRLRARLHWDPAAATLGFRGARSHRVVRIDGCRTAPLGLTAKLLDFERVLAGRWPRAVEVEWLEELAGQQAVAGVLGGREEVPRWSGVAGFWRVVGGGHGAGWGARGVVMALPTPLFVPVGGFFQASRELVPQLFQRVALLTRTLAVSRVVDLYGGVGFLAAAAGAGGARELTVVEGNPLAARAARANLPGARVVATACQRFLDRERLPADALVIVDPPRAGLAAPVREALVAQRPPFVLLLACDAARFGRDGAALLAGGYALSELQLWDMFPGTHHVEILALFSHQ